MITITFFDGERIIGEVNYKKEELDKAVQHFIRRVNSDMVSPRNTYTTEEVKNSLLNQHFFTDKNANVASISMF